MSEKVISQKVSQDFNRLNPKTAINRIFRI